MAMHGHAEDAYGYGPLSVDLNESSQCALESNMASLQRKHIVEQKISIHHCYMNALLTDCTVHS